MRFKYCSYKGSKLQFDDVQRGQENMRKIINSLDFAFGLKNKPVFPLLKKDTVDAVQGKIKAHFKRMQAKFVEMKEVVLPGDFVLKLATFLWRLDQLTLFSKKALSPSTFNRFSKPYFMFERCMCIDDSVYFAKIGAACCQDSEQYQLFDDKGKFRRTLTKAESDHNQQMKNDTTSEASHICVMLVEYISFAAMDSQVRLVPLREFMTGKWELVGLRGAKFDFDSFMVQFVDYAKDRIGGNYETVFEKMSMAAKTNGGDGKRKKSELTDEDSSSSDDEREVVTLPREDEEFQPFKRHRIASGVFDEEVNSAETGSTYAPHVSVYSPATSQESMSTAGPTDESFEFNLDMEDACDLFFDQVQISNLMLVR
jgi:hypothetical protein